MARSLFELEPALVDHRRFPAFLHSAQRIRVAEIACLVFLGSLAAAVTQWWDFNLRIPGHAILRVIFPITLGMVLVPRRGAGATVGLIGTGVSFLIQSLRLGSAGEGAMTSLALSGLLLDAAATLAQRGWQLYAGLVSAALITNLIAFAAKATAKYSTGGGKPWDTWWPRAIVSYPLCGIAAGLICAVLLFRLRSKTNEPR